MGVDVRGCVDVRVGGDVRVCVAVHTVVDIRVCVDVRVNVLYSCLYNIDNM